MEYKVVGYGSLISHNSLKEDIGDKRFKPVIVKGFKRIFDIYEGKRGDVLNLEEDKKGKFNGVMFKVDENELRKLRKREDVYGFEKKNVYDFKTRKKIGKALLFIDFFIDIDKKKKLPDKRYFILCREAVYHISKEFGRMWDKTTFVADGERVDKWIKKHGDFDSL